MKISKQEEYGLRCILQLARAGQGKSVSVSEISRCEGLSTDYVTKLLVVFRKVGIIASARGINGGYTLKRPPAEISLADVMKPLGGFFYPREFCAEFPGKLQECAHLGSCGIRPVWTLVAKQIYSTLNRTSLSDLLMEEKEVERRLASRAATASAVASAAV